MQNRLNIVRDVSANLDATAIGYMLTGSTARREKPGFDRLRPRLHRTLDGGTWFG
jgi:hypothetical protein